MSTCPRVRRILHAALVSVASVMGFSVWAQDSLPTRTSDEAAAEVIETFAGIRKTYLEGDITPEKSIEAYEEIIRVIDGGLDRDYGHVAAEMIYNVIRTSAPLLNRQDALEAIAEAAYEHQLADTSAAGQVSFLFALGNLEFDRGEYGAAATILDSVLARDIVPGSEIAFASGYNIRGFTYRAEGDWERAPAAFARAVEIYESVPGQEGVRMRSLAYAAGANADVKKFDLAIEQSNAAMDLLRQLGGDEAVDPALASSVLQSHSTILQLRGDYAGAIAVAMRALAVRKRTKEIREVAAAYWHLAHLARLEGRREDALAYYWEALEFVPAHADPRTRQTILEDLSHVFIELGDYKQAYYVQDLSHRIADSLTRATQALNVARLEENAAAHRVRLELERARAAAASQAVTESRRTLALTWGAFALVTLIGAVAYLAYRFRRKAAEHDRLEGLVAARTADLEEHAGRLERSNHELERFAYIASHDLKTPIRNVTSFLGLIRRRLAADAQANVSEYVDLAIGYAHQMNTLVTDVLEFSRIDANMSAPATPVNVWDLADKFCRERSVELKRDNATVEIIGTAEVCAPEAYLSQVLSNLVDNGLKYNTSPFPRVRVDISQEDDTAIIRVSDNGIGIAPEYHELVFEMFKRLHTGDEYPGTGLGLAVCKKVVERLGGTIALESAEGEGSTFTVTVRTSMPAVAERREALTAHA